MATRLEVAAVRWVSIAALVSWVVLCALQYGLIPIARHLWAVNLWGYHPAPLGGRFALLALTVSFSEVRERIAAAARRLMAAIGDGPRCEVAISLGVGTAKGGFVLRGNRHSGPSTFSGCSTPKVPRSPGWKISSSTRLSCPRHSALPSW